MVKKSYRRGTTSIGSEPLWYKNAIIYEIPIRAYCDSNRDGIGDINGLISKLDYLSELGVTAIWLLPFYPSPLRDGGYDISDYTSVHPMYGSLADFKRLLKEAHERGIRVITELVINHTSKDHPWFEKSRSSPPGSKWRNFYVWSDTDALYGETRIIFRDFEPSNWTWDPVAQAFYWHRFYCHQPDLNFDNPEVHKAVFKALDFWLDMGVDGLRLDAIPYLYEREGTNCENLPETHAFLKKLRAHVDQRYSDRMLLAEANQWPEDAAAYFGEGDECHMNFHFPLMPRMFMAVQLEDQFPIVDILRQTPEIPENCQWATFLRNHDELTLEMVTDEDRDYMYRVYAQDPTARLNLGIRRRLAPLLGTRQKVELMNGLLFSLPGTPVLYYGDEIGMGDNIYLGDRDGVRTPMQWSADRNAGFSEANPQKLYLPVISDLEYRYEAVNVEAQQNNPASLLWWMKRTIALRKQYPALSSGDLQMLPMDNPKILSFLRVLEEEKVLVVANLSRFHQCIELELPEFDGHVPVEMSGVVRFPKVTKAPYRLSLSPFGFMWFLLEPKEAASKSEASVPTFEIEESWTEIWTTSLRKELAKRLRSWVSERRWFRGKGVRQKGGSLDDVLVQSQRGDHALFTFTIEFAEAQPQTYLIPVALCSQGELEQVEAEQSHAIIAYLEGSEQRWAVVDSVATAVGAESILSLILSGSGAKGQGKTLGAPQPSLKAMVQVGLPHPKAAHFEQTNSTLLFGDQLLVKIYRQVEYGTNSELEIGEFLTNKVKGTSVPRVLGGLSYRAANGDDKAVIALVQEFVANQGTAWELSLDRVGSFFDAILTRTDLVCPAPYQLSRVAASAQAPSELGWDLIGSFLSLAKTLGQRTAEVHVALSSRKDRQSFAPEAFSTMHQQSIFQWTRGLLVRTFDALGRKTRQLPASVSGEVRELVKRQSEIEKLLRRVTRTKLDAQRIRCHGDLHLGQVLFTGDDFVLIDFEGEPARPLNERSYKRSPLRDVMGMNRSFNYVTESSLRSGRYRERDIELLRPWAGFWEDQVSRQYLAGYLEVARGRSFLPKTDEQIELLLSFFGIEKAVYEIGYEMNNRPDWLEIPVRGLTRILDAEGL